MTQQVFDMEKFQEQGYLVARDVLDPEEDLAPVFTEYESCSTVSLACGSKGARSPTHLRECHSTSVSSR